MSIQSNKPNIRTNVNPWTKVIQSSLTGRAQMSTPTCSQTQAAAEARNGARASSNAARLHVDSITNSGAFQNNQRKRASNKVEAACNGHVLTEYGAIMHENRLADEATF